MNMEGYCSILYIVSVQLPLPSVFKKIRKVQPIAQIQKNVKTYISVNENCDHHPRRTQWLFTGIMTHK